MWNARFPEVIVQAGGEEDVVSAVLIARERGLRVGVRSGGHSWAGNHVRDGGMLLDVSRLTDVEIDAGRMRAVVGRCSRRSASRACSARFASTAPG